MNKRIWLYCLLYALIAACSSDEDDGQGTVVFHVAVDSVAAYSVTATITHNGSNRDSYYAYAVEGRVSNVRDEVVRLLDGDRRQSVLASVMSQRKHVTTLRGLSPSKDYTVIVFGLDASGQLYGEPAAATFTTAMPTFTPRENSGWTVAYEGHKVYHDWDYSLVSVTLQGDAEQRYILYTCTAGESAAYATMDAFIVHAIDDFTQKENSLEDRDFWLDASEVRIGSTNFYRYLEPGDYEAFAIGLHTDGTPTGSYARCEPFRVDPYPYTEDYASLLGDDHYFVDENDRWYFVTFSPRIVNRSYNMTGWGNYDEFSIVVNFDRNTSALTIPYQRVTSEPATVSFSDRSETGYIYLVGAYYNIQDHLRWTQENHTIAKGTLQSDGSYHFSNAFTVSLSDEAKATKMGMTFVVQRSLSDRVGFSRMMFPFQLKRWTNDSQIYE